MDFKALKCKCIVEVVVVDCGSGSSSNSSSCISGHYKIDLKYQAGNKRKILVCRNATLIRILKFKLFGLV